MRLVDWIRKLMWRILGDPPDPPALRIGKTYLVFPALETPLSLEAGRLYYRSIGGRAVPYTQDGSQEYEVGSILSQQKIIPPSAGADALVIRSYDDSIDRLKILEDGSIITGTGTVGKLDSATGVLELAKLKMTGDLDMGGYVAKNLGAPVDPNDSARKSDVDTVQSNLDTHRTSIPIDHPDGSITDEKIAEMSRTKLKPPVLEGLIADRPSAGVAGRIYIATDERKVYRDTGTAWEEITAVERLADHEAKKTDVHGVASPDEIAGKSYVDDSISAHEGKALDGVHKVLTGNEADMPPAGEAGRIYIATDTLKIFRDTGTEWKELTAVGRLNTHEGKNTGVHGAGANYLAYASVSDYIADTELSNHEGKSTGVHGVGSSYICKTSRSDQLPSWGDIPDKPSEFPPEPHTHPISDITDIVNIAELRRDTSANRPTAGTAGRIFFETDTKRVLFDDGSAWLQLGVAKWDNLEGKPSQFPPEPHASSHRVGGADQLFDQNLNTTDSVKFANIRTNGYVVVGDPVYIEDFTEDHSADWEVDDPTYLEVTWDTANGRIILKNPSTTDHYARYIYNGRKFYWRNVQIVYKVMYPTENGADWGGVGIENAGDYIDANPSRTGMRYLADGGEANHVVYPTVGGRYGSGLSRDVIHTVVINIIGDYIEEWVDGVLYWAGWTDKNIFANEGRLKIWNGYNAGKEFYVYRIEVRPLRVIGYSSETTKGKGLLSGGEIVPIETNSYDLGKADHRWRNVYLHHLNFANQIRDDYIKLWDYYLIGIRSYTWFAQSNQRFQFKSREANNTDYPEIFQLLRSDESVAFGVRYDGAITTFGGFGTHVLPISDNAYDLGSSSYRWANVYGVNVYASSVYSGLLRGTDVYASNVYASAKVKVGDLEFENKWKFTEHPKYGIVLVSPKGKKYRLVLEEIAE